MNRFNLGNGTFIELTTSNPEETGRYARLHNVIGYLTKCESVMGRKIIERIAELHDHKGELTVSWRADFDRVDAVTIDQAWASPIGDGCGLPVMHHRTF